MQFTMETSGHPPIAGSMALGIRARQGDRSLVAVHLEEGGAKNRPRKSRSYSGITTTVDVSRHRLTECFL